MFCRGCVGSVPEPTDEASKICRRATLNSIVVGGHGLTVSGRRPDPLGTRRRPRQARRRALLAVDEVLCAPSSVSDAVLPRGFVAGATATVTMSQGRDVAGGENEACRRSCAHEVLGGRMSRRNGAGSSRANHAGAIGRHGETSAPPPH